LKGISLDDNSFYDLLVHEYDKWKDYDLHRSCDDTTKTNYEALSYAWYRVMANSCQRPQIVKLAFTASGRLISPEVYSWMLFASTRQASRNGVN
jgi:hypothetical protein